MTKFYKYRWLFAWIAGFITAFIILYLVFNENLKAALDSTVGGSIGGGIAIFFIYYFETKKLNRDKKDEVSDTTMLNDEQMFAK